jgi:hypothetical protein
MNSTILSIISIVIVALIMYFVYVAYSTSSTIDTVFTPESLKCPPNTQQGGLFCYEKCNTNETWDNLGTCYRKKPTVGVVDTLPYDCMDGLEKHLSLCYRNPDKSRYEFQSAGLYKLKCKPGYYWNGTSCWRDPKMTTMPHFTWQWGDPAFDYTPAKRRCNAANPQGCQKWGCCIWRGKCKPGERDDGTSCWVDDDSYGLGSLKSVIGVLPARTPKQTGSLIDTGVCSEARPSRVGHLCYKNKSDAK